VTERLNVRAGPGTEYEVVGQMTRGTRFAVFAKCTNARDELWLMIGVSSEGQQRWISGSPRYVSYWNIDNLICVQAPRPVTNPHFRADHTTIRAGECTTLRWDVEGIRAVYLDGQGKVGHGSAQVCPPKTQTFELKVIERDGREVDHPLTITVSGTAPQSQFIIEYRGCIGGLSRGIGKVQGQVFDRQGRIIVGARVGIRIDGQWWNSPANPARTNEAGWYEWNLTPGQRIRFVSLEVGGRQVAFSPRDFEVDSVGGCYQHVNFKQR